MSVVDAWVVNYACRVSCVVEKTGDIGARLLVACFVARRNYYTMHAIGLVATLAVVYEDKRRARFYVVRAATRSLVALVLDY
jgi:hypothetical protein